MSLLRKPSAYKDGHYYKMGGKVVMSYEKGNKFCVVISTYKTRWL